MTSSQLRVTFGATQPKEEDIRAVLEVLRSGQLRLGRVCQELERLVSTAVGCPHTVAMSSCTAALHSCLSMIDVRGREVILPSLTFSATAAAIVHAGGIPRFAEVSPESLTLDCKHAERLITRKTAAMIPVHIFGIPCDMTTLGAMAKGHSIFLVEDCAYGLGSRWDGVSVGTVGTAGCFSFGVLKNVTTGEGGAVTVKEQDLAQRLREFRNYGMRVSRTGMKTHVCPGLNCKLTDIQAALGVSQLRRLENILEKKRRIFSWYNARLETVRAVSTPKLDIRALWNHTFYVLRLQVKQPSAREVHLRMLQQGVETQVFSPLHLEPWVRERSRVSRGSLPVTEQLTKSLIALPSHLDMTERVVDLVVMALRKALNSRAG